MKNYPNLISNSERSPNELREMGRKGGIASGVKRRRQQQIRKECKMWMEILNEIDGNKVKNMLKKHLK